MHGAYRVHIHTVFTYNEIFILCYNRVLLFIFTLVNLKSVVILINICLKIMIFNPCLINFYLLTVSSINLSCIFHNNYYIIYNLNLNNTRKINVTYIFIMVPNAKKVFIFFQYIFLQSKTNILFNISIKIIIFIRVIIYDLK